MPLVKGEAILEEGHAMYLFVISEEAADENAGGADAAENVGK